MKLLRSHQEMILGANPMYWMITNRNAKSDGFGDEFSKMTFWKNESDNVDDLAAWKSMSADEFRQSVVQVADTFADPISTPSEDQKHVTIFVHGFDNSWSSAVQRYGRIVENLFSGPESLGLCILFTWPSEGSPIGYYPDRSEARKSAEDFADVLSSLYDWMAMKQAQAAQDPKQACKAKTSVIAHSMGNYVVENAMNFAWTRNLGWAEALRKAAAGKKWPRSHLSASRQCVGHRLFEVD